MPFRIEIHQAHEEAELSDDEPAELLWREAAIVLAVLWLFAAFLVWVFLW